MTIGLYFVSNITKKDLVRLKNKDNKELRKSIASYNGNLFSKIWMVSMNSKISQKTNLIKVVMIVSKILSTMLFRTTNTGH